MTTPRSPHAVARIVPKNPRWALDSTVVYVSGKGQATQVKEQPRMQAERNAHFAGRTSEERETD
jgi:hypothetical protein